MNAAALLTLLAAWLCFFLAPSGGFSRDWPEAKPGRRWRR